MEIDSMILCDNPSPVTSHMLQSYYHKYKTIPAVSFMEFQITLDTVKEFIDLEKTDEAVIFAIKLYSMIKPYNALGNSCEKKHYTVWWEERNIENVNSEIRSLLNMSNDYNYVLNCLTNGDQTYRKDKLIRKSLFEEVLIRYIDEYEDDLHEKEPFKYLKYIDLDHYMVYGGKKLLFYYI